MKIAIIGSKGIPATFGGVERHTEELAIGLVRKGNDVTVYSRKWYTNFDGNEYKGVKIKNIRSIKTKNLDTISNVFLSTLDAIRGNFDIIHYQGVGPALLSFIPRLFSKAKVIVTFHSEDYRQEKWGLFARIMLRLGEKAASYFPHKTITVSNLLKYKVEKIYNAEAEYIPNGVNNKKIAKLKKEKDDIFSKYDIEPGSYIAIITRLIKHKGVHLAIQAYKNLNKDLKKKYKLVIVGGATFGDSYEQDLRDEIGDDKNIVMTGMQSGIDLEKLFLGSKLFVHASFAEGLPIAVLEALNYQKPVLVSDIPEHLEIIENGINGFTFKSGSIISLKKSLEKLLDPKHGKMLEDACHQGKELVKKEFNWVDVVSKTNKLYKEVLKDNKKVSKLQTAN